jgi:hypothetical protein
MENDGVNVNIIEITQTTTETSSRIGIFVKSVTLFKSADVLVYFYNSSNNVIRAEMLKLEGDDYINWGLDDKYIETYVLNKLNLTPQALY